MVSLSGAFIKLTEGAVRAIRERIWNRYWVTLDTGPRSRPTRAISRYETLTVLTSSSGNAGRPLRLPSGTSIIVRTGDLRARASPSLTGTSVTARSVTFRTDRTRPAASLPTGAATNARASMVFPVNAASTASAPSGTRVVLGGARSQWARMVV